MTTDIEKECDLIAEYLLNIDEKYSGKIKNIRRIRRSLKWFAEEDNEKCLLFIKDIADKYVHQDGNDINDAWIFHYSQRNELFHKLDLDYVLKIMYESNTNFKNNILYNLGSTHKELLEFKILSAPRIFPADKVYEVLREDIRKYYMVSPCLSRAYGIEYNKNYSDSQRIWDKRWASFFLDMGNIGAASNFIYDEDSENWDMLLSYCRISPRENYENNRQFRQDCKYFVDLLNRAKRNKHPKYEFYCNEFISQGLPKDLLK